MSKPCQKTVKMSQKNKRVLRRWSNHCSELVEIMMENINQDPYFAHKFVFSEMEMTVKSGTNIMLSMSGKCEALEWLPQSPDSTKLFRVGSFEGPCLQK